MHNHPQTRITLRQKIVTLLLGMLLALILLEAGLRLGGLVMFSLQEYRNQRSLRQRGEYRILCLGESTTVVGNYPALLEEELNRRNPAVKFSVLNKGVIGTNTSLILYNLTSNLDEYRPDMVITMMGLNDCGEHLPYEPISRLRVINFFKSFRTYKLTRLLWLHIVTRLKEVGLVGYTAQLEPPLQPKGSPQVYKQEEAVEVSPNNDKAYVELGRSYQLQNKFPEAEAAFKKDIELNPKNKEVYLGIGWIYLDQGKLSEAEAAFKKDIELNPQNGNAYLGLGFVYSRTQNKFPEAEAAFRKAIELNPKNDKAYLGLVWSYRKLNKFPEAEAILRKAIEHNPRDDKAYGALATLYQERGNLRLAGEYAKKAKESSLGYYRPITADNYHKLKAALDERGITYVCMQYPMRGIEPLKKIFQDNPQGIIFVDNERVFKEAVNKAGYREYFLNIFGGDFGHCTPKGNRLLAENAAKVILKEVFDK